MEFIKKVGLAGTLLLAFGLMCMALRHYTKNEVNVPIQNKSCSCNKK